MLRAGNDAGVFDEKVDEAAVVKVLVEVGLLLGLEQAEQDVDLAGFGEGFDELAAEAGDLQVGGEGVGDGAGAELGDFDGLRAGEAGALEDLGNERGIVLGDDAEGIAGLVGEVGAGE